MSNLPVIIDPPSPRCTGHCCREFCLPYSPAELADAYDAWARGDDLTPSGRLIPMDIHLVYPMASWVRTSRFDLLGRLSDHVGHYYSCKHLAPNGDCSIYERRPHVCRDHASDGDCNFPGCTLVPKPKEEPTK